VAPSAAVKDFFLIAAELTPVGAGH